MSITRINQEAETEIYIKIKFTGTVYGTIEREADVIGRLPEDCSQGSENVDLKCKMENDAEIEIQDCDQEVVEKMTATNIGDILHAFVKARKHAEKSMMQEVERA